jgi:hypothetical protein
MTNQNFTRTFQLWEYRVSHGSLLIRSPQNENTKTNIDIICSGVEYLAAPRFLRGIEILEAVPEDLQQLGKILGKPVPASSVRIFASSGQRFPIVAASFKIEENERDIFEPLQ